MKLKEYKPGGLYQFGYADASTVHCLRQKPLFHTVNNEVAGYLHYGDLVTFIEYKKKKRSSNGKKYPYYCTKILKGDGTMGWLIQSTQNFRCFKPVLKDDFRDENDFSCR